MGLEQYIRAGAALQRKVTTLSTDSIGTGSVDLGTVYALLNITTTAPCRVRLYDNSQSLANVGEISRPFKSLNISASVALVADISMSVAGPYTIDPALYGVVTDTDSKFTYYRIENTQSGQFPVISFTTYLMEDPIISTNNRVTIPDIMGLLSPNQIISGTLASNIVPRTYLLVSASTSGSSTRTRLRLYSTTDSLSNTTELSRSFATESSATSKLIVDAILSGSETTYFVPKIAGANLQTMGTNLNAIRTNQDAIMGNNEMYYVLQNVATTGGSVPITASLHVFSLED
jgi:hypothetical protein